MNKLTSQELIEEFKKIQQNQLDIMIRKNSDYSGAMAFKNFDMVEVLGICSAEEGLLTRITDKISRASNLLKREAKVTDESIVDTILDASNYMILLAVYMKTKIGNRTLHDVFDENIGEDIESPEDFIKFIQNEGAKIGNVSTANIEGNIGRTATGTMAQIEWDNRKMRGGLTRDVTPEDIEKLYVNLESRRMFTIGDAYPDYKNKIMEWLRTNIKNTIDVKIFNSALMCMKFDDMFQLNNFLLFNNPITSNEKRIQESEPSEDSESVIAE